MHFSFYVNCFIVFLPFGEICWSFAFPHHIHLLFYHSILNIYLLEGTSKQFVVLKS